MDSSFEEIENQNLEYDLQHQITGESSPEIQPIERAQPRSRRKPTQLIDYVSGDYLTDDDPAVYFALFVDYDPLTFHQAAQDPKWQHAINEKMRSIEKNMTSECNSICTLIEFGLKFLKDKGGMRIDATLYKKIVGSLMYLTLTKPDIMYGVSLVSRFMESPTENHLFAAKKDFSLFKRHY